MKAALMALLDEPLSVVVPPVNCDKVNDALFLRSISLRSSQRSLIPSS
jgi:hypothetical protein